MLADALDLLEARPWVVVGTAAIVFGTTAWVTAVVEVENPEEKLRPGMTATVTIKTKEVKGALRIANAALRYKPTPPLGPNGKPLPQPPEAPLSKGNGRVFVLVNDKPGEEKAEPRVIQIGITDGINTEVTGGLSPDAKVVTDEVDDEEKKQRRKKIL